jgi:hypothetical protein
MDCDKKNVLFFIFISFKVIFKWCVIILWDRNAFFFFFLNFFVIVTTFKNELKKKKNMVLWREVGWLLIVMVLLQRILGGKVSVLSPTLGTPLYGKLIFWFGVKFWLVGQSHEWNEIDISLLKNTVAFTPTKRNAVAERKYN